MAAPSSFGRYRVIELLGKGAMGEVYKAVDTEVFDRVVAVKVLSDRLSENEQAKKRFENEVRAAATLDHPNIVRIYDRGIAEDGRPFLVMEMLDGPDLGELTSGKETRDLDVLVDLSRQIADALDHAHERGIVHRDVKPSNIKVVHQGGEEYAKLLDFGIVHVEGSNLTRTTDQPGTWSYMDPERMRGLEADNRSDLFSLGIVLYELFTHVHPFQAPTQPMLLARIMNDQPERPRKLNPELPSQLEAIILKLLEKDPEQRPPRAKEIVNALRDIMSSLRSTEVAGTPSDISADEVTAQAVRTLMQRARRFESDGDREQALKLWKKAAALAPEELKLTRKVERLEHEIQRDRNLENNLGEARRSLDAGDVFAARSSFEKAWLLSPDHPRVLDFKILLEMAEQRDQPASVAAPPAALPSAMQLILHVMQDEAEGWRVEARNLLIAHLRMHADDRIARQWLDAILDGRKPAIEAYARPPAPWTEEDRGRLGGLRRQLERSGPCAEAVAPTEVATLGGYVEALRTLEAGPRDEKRLGELEQQIERSCARVFELLSAEARSRAGELERISRAASDAIDPVPLERARHAIADLAALGAESSPEETLAALQAADTARQGIRSAAGEFVEQLRERVAKLPPALQPGLLEQLDRWESGPRTDPLGALTHGIEAAERGSIENLVGDIRNWSRLLDGSGAIEQTALERFLAIASELARADPQTARQRTVVASSAVDALRTTHGRASAQLAKSRESLRGGVEELLPLASEAERAQARDLLERPLPDRLVDAQEVIAAIRQWMVSLRAREEQQVRRTESLAADAERTLADAWLEQEVGSLEGATTAAQALVVRAREAQAARERLAAALSAARAGAGPAATRAAALEQALAAAQAAIEASRSAHEKELKGSGARREALLRKLAPWKDMGLPEKLHSRVERIDVPSPPAEPAPSAIRAYVQQLESASAELGALEAKIGSVRSELALEATALRQDIDRVLGRPRFPRLRADLREQLEASRTKLASSSEAAGTDLAEWFAAVREAGDRLGAVGANLLPWIGAAVLAAVLATGAWLTLAPRELRVVPGLATGRPWLTPEGSDRRIEGQALDDGTVTFRVGRGRYVVQYVENDENRSHPVPIAVGLGSLPVPFTTANVAVGERPEDRLYELLKREYPDLISGP